MESRDTLGHPAEGLFPSAHPNWVARAKQSLPVMRRHPRTPRRVGQSQTRSRFLHVPSQPPGPSCVRAHGNAPLLPPMRRRELGGHPQTLGKGISSLCTLLWDSCKGSIDRGPTGHPQTPGGKHPAPLLRLPPSLCTHLGQVHRARQPLSGNP
jgi:hypothetical protein